jgi:hypothetical protein
MTDKKSKIWDKIEKWYGVTIWDKADTIFTLLCLSLIIIPYISPKWENLRLFSSPPFVESTGECTKGSCIHGEGTFVFNNGQKYVGKYRYAKRNGQGTYTWPDGRKYVGEWRDGDQHGYGTYTWPSGEKYVGEWKNNKRHGQGTNTMADGTVIEGPWENDKHLLSHTTEQ